MLTETVNWDSWIISKSVMKPMNNSKKKKKKWIVK